MTIPRIELARLPTPLVPLDRVSSHIKGPRIWLKRDDLTDTTASGNKLRKLEFCVGRALEEDASVLITCGGIQSNHCRTTAVVAATLGLKCHLILRGKQKSPPDGNHLLDYLVGAKISWVGNKSYEELDDVYAQLEQDYRNAGDIPYSMPIGASDETGLWGYIEAARELKQDFEQHGISPGYIVSAAGSGGTLGGLILGKKIHDLATNMVAFNVCDDEAWFVDKIRADMARWENRYGQDFDMDTGALPITVIDGFVGPGYARAEPQVFDTIKWLARTEGVILDPVYTGKAFNAMLEEIGHGRFQDTEDIVFLHTGGIFGIFPQREQF
ncbi:MAG: D-cysteine desulfhydrase family protein [Pseudomonadales bacterium]